VGHAVALVNGVDQPIDQRCLSNSCFDSTAIKVHAAMKSATQVEQFFDLHLHPRTAI
jgi:hypothetical protein